MAPITPPRIVPIPGTTDPKPAPNNAHFPALVNIFIIPPFEPPRIWPSKAGIFPIPKFSAKSLESKKSSINIMIEPIIGILLNRPNVIFLTPPIKPPRPNAINNIPIILLLP